MQIKSKSVRGNAHVKHSAIMHNTIQCTYPSVRQKHSNANHLLQQRSTCKNKCYSIYTITSLTLLRYTQTYNITDFNMLVHCFRSVAYTHTTGVRFRNVLKLLQLFLYINTKQFYAKQCVLKINPISDKTAVFLVHKTNNMLDLLTYCR